MAWPSQGSHGVSSLNCLNHSLKPNYIFSLAGAVSLRGHAPGWQPPCGPAWVRCLPTHSRGTHLTGGTEEGASTVAVPVKGGHLHNGAAVATLEPSPQCLPLWGPALHPVSHHGPVTLGHPGTFFLKVLLPVTSIPALTRLVRSTMLLGMG